jgi:hypothetical protein
MSVAGKSVPRSRLNHQDESVQKNLVRNTVVFFMRACACMYATQQSLYHRHKIKINNKIEILMWDNRTWDGVGTVALVMEASHG